MKKQIKQYLKHSYATPQIHVKLRNIAQYERELKEMKRQYFIGENLELPLETLNQWNKAICQLESFIKTIGKQDKNLSAY